MTRLVRSAASLAGDFFAREAPTVRFARRNATVIATIAVILLPGGSLIAGAMWLYRYIRVARAAA